MKSIVFNYSDLAGGAAIAAYRTHQSLRRVGVDSSMWVNKKLSDDWTVKGPAGMSSRVRQLVRSRTGVQLPELLFNDDNAAYRSYNWIDSRWVTRLNRSDADIVNLQWINAESLSIRDVCRLKKPIVMTLQDMWAFCGAEHYSEAERWKHGYMKESKPSSIHGVDLDRWTWKRKEKHWQTPFQLVAISEWLANCARKSTLFQDWPIDVIPNPVDTGLWKPVDKSMARDMFNLPVDRKIVLFGALGGTSNPRKGYSYLNDALSRINQERDDIHLVIYGQSTPVHATTTHYPTTYTGRLSDPITMCLLNNAADVFVNPAVQEAFGQTASEAHACGLPVVAFDDTGIADIVDHRLTGYLAPLRDSGELAKGISWVLDNDSSAGGSIDMRGNARKRAVDHFSYEETGRKYRELFNEVLSR